MSLQGLSFGETVCWGGIFSRSIVPAVRSRCSRESRPSILPSSSAAYMTNSNVIYLFIYSSVKRECAAKLYIYLTITLCPQTASGPKTSAILTARASMAEASCTLRPPPPGCSCCCCCCSGICLSCLSWSRADDGESAKPPLLRLVWNSCRRLRPPPPPLLLTAERPGGLSSKMKVFIF